MKPMAYVIIAATALVVIGVIVAGCSATPANKEIPPIDGISLSQNHMDYSCCYSFYLREDGEKVLFDADFAIEEEPYRIIVEGFEADASYMDKLRELDSAKGISDYVFNFKEIKSPVEALDATVNKTTVFYADGTIKSAESRPEHIDALYKLFLDLTKEYMNKTARRE